MYGIKLHGFDVGFTKISFQTLITVSAYKISSATLGYLTGCLPEGFVLEGKFF